MDADTDRLAALPPFVMVDENGNYWRAFDWYYSMCPVSTDNDPVRPIVIYQRLAAGVTLDPRPIVCPCGAEYDGHAWTKVRHSPDALTVTVKWMDDNAAKLAALVAEVDSLRAVPTPPDALTPHPGENHDYRMTCLRCGEPGYLFVGFHSPGETFRWMEADHE